MTLRKLLLFAAAAVAVSTTTFAAILVVDQSAPAADPPIPFTWAVGGGQVLSQTVTAGVAGRLWEVRVPIGCAGGDVLLQIRDVTPAGLPGPTVLYSRTFSGEDFPEVVTSEFRSFRLIGRPVRFAAGDRLTISLANETSTCGVWPGPLGSSYAGGGGWAEGDDGSVVSLSVGTDREDLPFMTIVQAR
jgi:hypothetical protein